MALALAANAEAQSIGAKDISLPASLGTLPSRAQVKLKALNSSVPDLRLDDTDIQLVHLTRQDEALDARFLGPSANTVMTRVRNERLYWDAVSKLDDAYLSELDLPPLKAPSVDSTPEELKILDRYKAKIPVEPLLALRLADQSLMLVRPGEADPSPLPPTLAQVGPPPVLGQSALTADGRVNIKYWPKGFSEVGVLARNGIADCTATMIGQRVALTAAHCVLEDRADGIARLVPAEALLFFPEMPEGEAYYTTSVTGAGKPRRIDRRSKLKVLKVETYLQGDRQARLTRDLAIIQLEPFPTPHPVASLAKTSDLPAVMPFDVTFVGYGMSLFNGEKGAALQVGWQKIDKTKPTTISWSPDGHATLSATCGGDSGGPLFLGAQRGLQGEQRKLVAVISLSGCLPAGQVTSRSSAAYLDGESLTWLSIMTAALDEQPLAHLALATEP